MKIKFMQVNIFAGRYFENLVDFLKMQDVDIIAAQEVSAGRANRYEDKSADLFELLKRRLGVGGVFANVIKYRDWPEAKFGNAVFAKFEIVKKKIITLKKFRPITHEEVESGFAHKIRPLLPRNMIDAKLDVSGMSLHALSVHGAWTAPPTVTKENTRQAKIIAKYLKSLGSEPFILGADLNMTPQTKVVALVSSVAKNWMIGSDVLQTTHPTVHKIAPRGFLVDYIFTSGHFKLESLEVPEVLISDHLPVVAEFEL